MDKDDEKRDEVLKRLLKMPPKPRSARRDIANGADRNDDKNPNPKKNYHRDKD